MSKIVTDLDIGLGLAVGDNNKLQLNLEPIQSAELVSAPYVFTVPSQGKYEKKQLVLDMRMRMRIAGTDYYVLAGRTEVTNEAPYFTTYHSGYASDYRQVGLHIDDAYDPSTDYIYVPPAKAELTHQDDTSVLYEFDLIASETGIKVTHNGSEVVNGQTFEAPNFKREWTTYETDPNTLNLIPATTPRRHKSVRSSKNCQH